MTTKEISSSDINTIVSSKVIKRKKNMNKRIWHYNYQLALVDPFDHQKKVVGFFCCGEPLFSQDLDSNSPYCGLWLKPTYRNLDFFKLVTMGSYTNGISCEINPLRFIISLLSFVENKKQKNLHCMPASWCLALHG